ncbi:MAG: SMP-30/gluconolactonase/LRE family protein [Acetobacteraceae bacterium]|nr:SMP-30/gluconolactonase/LRE family protein [Acetobacteraceae bacterium]
MARLQVEVRTRHRTTIGRAWAGRAASALLGLFVAAGAAFAADPGFPAPSGDPSVLPSGARLDRVFDGACRLTEGVATSPDGMVYFSDITFTMFCKDPSGKYDQAVNIWRYDPKSRQATIFRSPSGMSNGMKFDAEGNLIIAEGADFGGRRLVKTDMKTGKSYILSGLYNGQPYNALNDLSIDEKGRIYFTDPRYLGWEPMNQPVQAVYRLDPDGKVTRLITDAGKPNGVQVSPDQKTLYVLAHDNGAHDFLEQGETSQKGLMGCLAYDLSPDGTVSNRREIIDWLPNDGGDGMTVDTEGNLYIAVRSEAAPGVYVYTPQGKQLAYIPTGKELPTNVAFGYGDDGNVLYLASGKSLYTIRLAKRGYHLPARTG